LTFILAAGYQDQEYQNFLLKFQEFQPDRPQAQNYKNCLPPKHCTENIWLLKPAAMNQGRGIEFFKNDLAGMRKSLQNKPLGSMWVVQKYIEKPLLYKGRKFDIRMWAIITWKNELFYYRFGYIRTSSYTYTLDDSTNYVHLTNNCLQVYSKEYGRYETGNTIGFHEFSKYLTEIFPGLDFERDLVSRMKDIMIDTYLANKDNMNPKKRRNCFELLGYDFLIDEDLRVWLLEVNSNPYIGIPNKYIEGLMPKMLNDMLEIVLDPYIQPANKIPDHELCNQFEPLYDERTLMNQRRSFSLALLYPGKHNEKIEQSPTSTILIKSKSPSQDKNDSLRLKDKKSAKYLKKDETDKKIVENNREGMIESITAMRGVNEDTFYKGPLFCSLAKNAFNPKSNMHDSLRKYIVFFILLNISKE